MRKLTPRIRNGKYSMFHQRTVLVMLFALCSIAVCFPVQPLADNTDTMFNQPKPSLALTIHFDGSELYVGDKIPIVFVIKNEGTTQYKYGDRNYDRSGRMPEYELSASDKQKNAVSDPRAKRQGGPGGGLTGEGRLAPGESYEKTVALNRWALLTNPGVYKVTGVYHLEGNWPGITSQSIWIKLLPRSDDEMLGYITDLSVQLADAYDGQARAALVRKLMYTCDRRIVPSLIEAMYKRDAASYWAGEAFHYYLPDDREIGNALLIAAEKRGLAGGMFWTLKECAFNGEKIKPLIEVSLSPKHPHAWPEGALAAQQYPADSFTPRLIAIATDPKSTARQQAIYALALNRTDESVATLKKLLREPAPPKPKGQTIRQTTENAIRAAYLYRGNSKGRRLRKDDFDARYQKPKDIR